MSEHRADDSLPRAVEVRPAGTWVGTPADVVTLDFDDRHRRRVALTGEGGLHFLLDLARAEALSNGDGLALEDGRVVEVKAADEALLEITTGDPRLLLRVAWHLGNRHLPTEVRPEALRIRDDHVIADMVRGLGADVERVESPFQPEGGAYGHGRVHGHTHGHDHGLGSHEHGEDEPGPDDPGDRAR